MVSPVGMAFNVYAVKCMVLICNLTLSQQNTLLFMKQINAKFSLRPSKWKRAAINDDRRIEAIDKM